MKNKIPGHYSAFVEHNGIIYISGILPFNPQTNDVTNNIEEQTKIVLQKLNKVLIDAGTTKEKVLQVRIYITDINYWDTVNTMYAEFFADTKPARCVVPVPSLHFGCKIELEAIAAKII